MPSFPESRDVTLVLREAASGSPETQKELFDLLYGELRRIADVHLSKERVDHTLQPTALVHEAWMKLVDQETPPEGGRSHFLSVASMAMRRILVDHSRTKKREKRGGGAARVGVGALPTMSPSTSAVAIPGVLHISNRRVKFPDIIIILTIYARKRPNDR